MKALTEKQYARLAKLEIKINKYAWSRKEFDNYDERLEKYRARWNKMVTRLGITSEFSDNVYYIVPSLTRNNRPIDYSHGYNFTDVLA